MVSRVGGGAQEREARVTVTVKGVSELPERVQTAACIPAVHERGLQGVPMAAPGDAEHLRPLLRELPDALKNIRSVSHWENRGSHWASSAPQNLLCTLGFGRRRDTK